MKLLFFAFCVVFAFGDVSALATGWQPSPGHTQMEIWPGTPPDAAAVVPTGPETVEVSKGLLAGKPMTGVRNVSRPTMTLYSPKGKNTGVAVIVFPGGG